MASARTLSFSRCRRSASRFPFGRRSLSRRRASASASSSSSVHASRAGAGRALASIGTAGRSASGPTRSRAYQNVPHAPHEYQAIAHVLPDIGATERAQSGHSMGRGGFIASGNKATSMPSSPRPKIEAFRGSRPRRVWRFLVGTVIFGRCRIAPMTKTAFSATLLTLAVSAAAAVGAQSTLSSLFDRYTVKADFAGLAAAGWGASTTSVAANGKGQVVVMVRAVPYFRVFTTDGAPVKTWGDAGLFNLAHSVHYAPDGSIWATDPNDHVVHKFSADGQRLLTLGKKGVAGDNASRDSFNQPNALGFAASGDVYVSDGYVNSRIVQFKADGTFVRIIGGTKGSGPGELQVPHGVAVDPQGRIVVADSDNKRVSVFDKDGRFVKTIAAPSRGGIVAAADGTIYVSDVNAGAVTVIRNDQIADVVKEIGRASCRERV